MLFFHFDARPGLIVPPAQDRRQRAPSAKAFQLFSKPRSVQSKIFLTEFLIKSQTNLDKK
jgi:hypothetical protein